MTGLADCNNFFVSCERTVDRSLEGKAVIVGSNNDGCVVARSNEAKALGIKMGQPVFEIRDLINSGKVIAISGHHLLYREISLKVHDIFRRYAPSTIDYSIDEAFLDMTGVPADSLIMIGKEINRACWDELHIPVTIGFAKTKTLSKIVTETCKKRGESVGMLIDKEETMAVLSRMPVYDLWGIGRRLSKRLYQSGVYTIADFAKRDRNWIRKSLGVNGEKTWLELHGVKCIELSHVGRPLQDSISETRTFPEDINDYDYLRARIAIYGADCTKKLRAMNGLCSLVSVFLRTNRFHPEKGIYSPEITIHLPHPSSDTMMIVNAGIEGLGRIFDPDVLYKRAGIILSEIIPASSYIRSLFDDDPIENHPESAAETGKLMRVVDRLNCNVGTQVLKLASQLTQGHPGHNDGYSSSFQAPFKKL